MNHAVRSRRAPRRAAFATLAASAMLLGVTPAALADDAPAANQTTQVSNLAAEKAQASGWVDAEARLTKLRVSTIPGLSAEKVAELEGNIDYAAESGKKDIAEAKSVEEINDIAEGTVAVINNSFNNNVTIVSVEEYRELLAQNLRDRKENCKSNECKRRADVGIEELAKATDFHRAFDIWKIVVDKLTLLPDVDEGEEAPQPKQPGSTEAGSSAGSSSGFGGFLEALFNGIHNIFELFGKFFR